MARSKEQWKAQKRRNLQAAGAFSQTGRPARPSAPPDSSALFQLGKPAAVSVAKTVKTDPVQTIRLQPSVDVHSAVIDLTEEDGEEEDEPMGQQVDTAVDVEPIEPVQGQEVTQAKGPEEQTERPSETMTDLGEDVESDVDEEWPSVPPSVDVRMKQTTEEVDAALDTIRKTLQQTQHAQEEKHAQNEADGSKEDEHSGRISLDDSDEEMEADVDEELPNQAPKPVENTSGLPDSEGEYRIVQLENLEDGEIYEEGVKKTSSEQLQLGVKQDPQALHLDAQPVDATKYLTARHMRGKKQKKRGKKKTKRKLDAMQMMHAPPGEPPLEYEQRYDPPKFGRMTRPRIFGDAAPPGQYTFAMMNNAPRGEPVNARPVFPGVGPVPFRPVNQFAGAPRPLMVPPKQPPIPRPPLPFGDSQILRVNRQGSMEMFNGESNLPLQKTLLDPPMRGGFKYRSVPNSPPKVMPGDPGRPLSISLASNTMGLPGGKDGSISQPGSKEKNDDADFDLDSLRAAALRTKRPSKTATPKMQRTTSSSSSSSPSSPDLTHSIRRHSEPSSPEIDELREQILLSMQRNRKRAATKATNNALPPTPPAPEENMTGRLESNAEVSLACSITGDVTVPDEAASVHVDASVSKDPTEPSPSRQPRITTTEQKLTEGLPGKPATTFDQGDSDTGKADPPTASPSEPAGVPAQLEAITPEFRPLTACSQSVVIHLSLDDFLPRKSSEGTCESSSKTNTVNRRQTYDDAIEEMRRQIAEREKKRQASRGTAKLQKESSSSSLSSSSSSSPHQVSSDDKIDETLVQPQVSASTPKKHVQSTTPSQNEVTTNGINGDASTNDVVTYKQSSVEKEKSITLPKTTAERQETTAADSSSRPAAKQLEVDNNNTSGDSSLSPTVEKVSAEKADDISINDQVASSISSTLGDGDGTLDFDAIRAEYEQCVAECEEAEANIARLSSEMKQLEKQLPPVEFTS